MPSTADAAALRPRSNATGYFFAVIASIGLGAAVAFSRAAYDGGTDPLSIATVRGVYGAAMVGVMCLALGRGVRVPWRVWRHCVWLGGLVSFMYYGNIGAVNYIPVGLAALLFFIYPPLVAIIMAAWDHERLGAVKITALATSFLGLAVMLGVDLDALDWRGVAIGLTAGVACALNASWIGRKMQGVDPFVMTFHMTVVASVILIVACAFTGGVTLPVTQMGWVGALGVVFFQGSSIPFFYAAIGHIGAPKASMLNNLQPVASIVIAYFLFTEAMTLSQGVGGSMVLGGILLMQWHDSRRRKTRLHKSD
ncbi:MAG: DMT family transporter [Rhodospirillaceae bacterium]|jgi:drug/metabolite transporter (DMT)-like permease|nr:DMT family transporter [Rhodospirillaceae bacterium]MBT5666276.1 DMT family transporter [Rhodospirillaceae bacterium]